MVCRIVLLGIYKVRVVVTPGHCLGFALNPRLDSAIIKVMLGRFLTASGVRSVIGVLTLVYYTALV